MTDKFVIGVIGSPHGLNGFVKVRSLSGEIEHFFDLKEITVAKDGNEKLTKIEEIKESPPGLLMRFESIGTMEKAKTLTGAKLIVGRERAALLNKGEFYIEDLKGLPVVTKDGEKIGQIIDIIEGGGGELVEIKLIEKGIRLVPFRKEFFPEISPEKSKIVIDNIWILD